MSTAFQLAGIFRRIPINHRLFFISRFVSSLVPTCDRISQLVLEQKTAEKALQAYQWASNIPGYKHSPSTYRALIHKLCTFRRFEVVDQLLDEMPKTIGSLPDDDIFITVVRGYGRARMIREMMRVLDTVTRFHEIGPSLRVMNSVLDVLVTEDIDIAREFYRKKMKGRGDEYTYGILMKGFCLTNRIGDGFKLLRVMKNHGVEVNVVVYNTLLHALCKNGKVGRARSLMNEMKEFSNVTFEILISAYCNESESLKALVMLEKCFENGFVPNVVSVTKLVETLCNESRVKEAVTVLERVEEKGGTLDVLAYNTLLRGFVKAGKVREGHGYLRKMEVKGCLPNSETYDILIGGFCGSGMLDSALDLFREMKGVGVNRHCVTFETLIYGLCSAGRTEDGFNVFESMFETQRHFCSQIGSFNSILYGLYKENRLDQAVEFLKYMRNFFPDTVIRSENILRSCRDGRFYNAKQTFDEMRKEGNSPSAIVYGSLIELLSQKGCMKEAVEMMNESISFGYFPVSSTCTAMIQGFCRHGQAGAAILLMKDMKMRNWWNESESCGLIIKELCAEGHEMNLELIMEMVKLGIVPDSCSWSALILSIFQGKNLIQEIHCCLNSATI